MTSIVDVLEARARLAIVQYEPSLSGVEHWLAMGVRGEVARFENEAAFKAGRPFEVSRFGRPDLDLGYVLEDGAKLAWKAIRGDGSLTLFSNANARLCVGASAAPSLTGTVTVTQNSTTVTGSGTAFSTELAVGDIISISSTGFNGSDLLGYRVTAIASNTSLTIDRQYVAATGAGVSAFRLRRSWTDLQSSTKTRKAMDSSFPAVEGDAVSGAPTNKREMVFRSTFGSSDHNADWREFGIANSASGATVLDILFSNQGTKVSGQVWQLTETLTF